MAGDAKNQQGDGDPPVAEQPVAEQPVAEQPVAEQPVAEPEFPKKWAKYRKHRQMTERDLKNGAGKRWTMGSNAPSQYHPLNYGNDDAVEALELACIEKGMLITGGSVKRTYYQQCDDYVGYCCGKLTKYSFAEWHNAGAYHGRPICESCLKKKPGVNL